MIALPRRLTAALADGGRGLSIVVVRLGALGDVVRTVPAVRLVRRACPSASITWVVESRWAIALRGHADLDALVELPRREWDALRARPSGWGSLVRELRAFRDRLRVAAPAAALAIDFHGNFRSGLCARWSGAAVRLGYEGHQQKEGNHWFTTHRVEAGPRRTPRAARNLALVRALGLPTAPLPDAGLPLARRGAAAAAALLASEPAGGTAIVCPGASRAQSFKKPPAALLAAAVRRLADRRTASLVVWGPGEEDDARAVVDAAGGAARLAPPTDLGELAALLERARLYVGGDTGPLHLACAGGCPALAIYGPTDPVVNRPWGVPFRTLAPPGRVYTGVQRLDRAAGGFEGLTAAHVERAVDALLAESAPAAQTSRTHERAADGPPAS